VLAGGLAAALLVQAAGIGYRVVQVPDEPGAEDDVRFVAGLPDVGENEGGRNFRTAADRMNRLAALLAPQYQPQQTAGPRPLLQRGVVERAELVPARGWPADDPKLSDWLDALYGEDARSAAGGVATAEDRAWYEMASIAATNKVGIYEHPQLIGTAATTQALDHARRLASVVLARGLQMQARDDPAEFVASLRVTVALAANLRNSSVVAALIAGHAVERATADAAERWLSAMDDDPDPLRAAVRVAVLWQAVEILRESDDPRPFDPRPHLLAERHVLREAQKAPAQWAIDRFAPPSAREGPNPEGDLLAFAWTVPWERERTRRLLGQGFEGGAWPPTFALVIDRPGGEHSLLVRRSGASELTADDLMMRVIRRGTLLRVAVRLHIEATGDPPASLAELVAPGHLRAVPEDPFDGRPFRYRAHMTTVLGREFGPPIVWSVGLNRVDDGGQARPRGLPNQPDDMVFWVPTRRRP
jgi:hypothetical protein